MKFYLLPLINVRPSIGLNQESLFVIQDKAPYVLQGEGIHTKSCGMQVQGILVLGSIHIRDIKMNFVINKIK